MNTEPETISVTDLRISTREILENAHFKGRHYVVERAGQAMVAILNIEEYRRWMMQPTLAFFHDEQESS